MIKKLKHEINAMFMPLYSYVIHTSGILNVMLICYKCIITIFWRRKGISLIQLND